MKGQQLQNAAVSVLADLVQRVVNDYNLQCLCSYIIDPHDK